MHKDFASHIDHTLLKEEATREEIAQLCLDALKYNFKGVCVYPQHLLQVAQLLKGKSPLSITVIDFPYGRKPIPEKVREAKEALQRGAQELDLVLDTAALKNKDYKLAFDGVKAVVEVTPIPVKVIIEAAQLSYEQKIIASALVEAAGAAFIKTSTGKFGGATVEDITLIRKIVGPEIKIKASGGIKTLQDCQKMLQAGADRIGTSSSVAVMGSLMG